MTPDPANIAWILAGFALVGLIVLCADRRP
jgi:hypothetical protein